MPAPRVCLPLQLLKRILVVGHNLLGSDRPYFIGGDSWRELKATHSHAASTMRSNTEFARYVHSNNSQFPPLPTNPSTAAYYGCHSSR